MVPQKGISVCSRCSDVRNISIVKCFCSNRPAFFRSTPALRKELGMKFFVFKYCCSYCVCKRRRPVEPTIDLLGMFSWRVGFTYAKDRTAVVSTKFFVIKNPSLRPADAKSWKVEQRTWCRGWIQNWLLKIRIEHERGSYRRPRGLSRVLTWSQDANCRHCKRKARRSHRWSGGYRIYCRSAQFHTGCLLNST